MDTLGTLSIPVDPTAKPVGDPLRAILADFLASILNADCQAAWDTIGDGRSKVVERVDTNDPNDNTFVTQKLPLLIVCRNDRGRKVTILAEEISCRESTVVALWIPPTAVQKDKAIRESFFQAIEGSVMDAMIQGRHPAWIYSGDTDPNGAAQGSYITGILGLFRNPSIGLTFDDTMVEIGMTPPAPPKKYPALKISFQLWEPLRQAIKSVIGPNTSDGTIVTNGPVTITDHVVSFDHTLDSGETTYVRPSP